MTSPAASKSDVLPDAQARAASHVFAGSRDLLGSVARDGYFTALNPAWERTLGFSCETLMEQPFIEFVYPADREATMAEFENPAAGDLGSEHLENRYAVRSGGWCWLSWQGEKCAESLCDFPHLGRERALPMLSDQASP